MEVDQQELRGRKSSRSQSFGFVVAAEAAAQTVVAAAAVVVVVLEEVVGVGL